MCIRDSKKLIKEDVADIADEIKESSSEREIVEILEKVAEGELTTDEAKALLKEKTTLSEKGVEKLIAKTKTKSGYAIAAAKDEFFVKFKYWFVVGGIIILRACGITTNFKIWLDVRPIDAAASFWPLLIPWIPALTHSATNVAV